MKVNKRPQVFNITVRSNDPEALVTAVHQYIRKADRHGVVNVYIDKVLTEKPVSVQSNSLLD